MKKIILFISCLLFCGFANAQAPTFEWAKGMGGVSNDYGESVATDTSGNVYTTGYFTDTVDFDPGLGTYFLSTTGYLDGNIFISK